MKRVIAVSLLVLCLSAHASAGEVPFPPAPPSCQQAPCPQSSTLSPIPPIVIDLVLSLITFRP